MTDLSIFKRDVRVEPGKDGKTFRASINGLKTVEGLNRLTIFGYGADAGTATENLITNTFDAATKGTAQFMKKFGNTKEVKVTGDQLVLANRY